MQLSSSFSGSTLLSMLVTSHPKFIGFGDTYNYQFVDWSTTRCTCGASPSFTCDVRVQIENEMNKNGFSCFSWKTSNPTPLPMFLAKSARFARYSRRTQGIYRAIPDTLRQHLFFRFYSENSAFLRSLQKLGYEYYFDGCKSLARLELLRSVIKDIKIVHIIKHPYSYMYSEVKRIQSRDVLRNFDGWLKYNSAALDYRELLGHENYCLVRFEDLVTDPEKTVADIYRFSGVGDVENILVNFKKENTHVVGNKMKDNFAFVQNKVENYIDKLDKIYIDHVNNRIEKAPWIDSIYPDIK